MNMSSSAYLSSYIFYSKVSFQFFAHLLLFNLESYLIYSGLKFFANIYLQIFPQRL